MQDLNGMPGPDCFSKLIHDVNEEGEEKNGE